MRLGKALATGFAEETGREPAAPAEQHSQDTVVADTPRPPEVQEQQATPTGATAGR
jgi:hypothetical protein